MSLSEKQLMFFEMFKEQLMNDPEFKDWVQKLRPRKRTARRRKPMKPPSYEELVVYAKTRDREDLAQAFFEYYQATKWYDKDGKKVNSWKGKFLTWCNRNKKPESDHIPKHSI